jgi:predicted ATPase/class 3 adenylate cyclase
MSAPAREVRKTVTILFCDLVHSTGLAEGDPEAYRRVQKRFFDRMREIVEAHGGTVEKFIGDEVMAVFGIPVVHEDDALRAVRAAQEMQDALPELGLKARIGINTGEVLAADPSQGLGLVAGEPVIVAKRLEQGAGTGEIIIGKATYPLVRHAVSAGPLERIPVKGKREGVGRRRVDEVDRDAPTLARRLDLPLIGRANELDLLRDAFERSVEQRHCRLFTVLGPPGIGKSRLAGELDSLLEERATTVVGRCLPYGEGITFWPLAEVLGSLGDLTEALGEDAGSVQQLLDGLTGAADPTASTEQAFWAVRRAFEAVARRRPLIVCLEDLHWAEPTFIDLVEYLVGWSRDAPILIVCLARPELVERRPTLIAPHPNADALALEPLSADETATLLDLVSGDLPGTVRERIGQAAEGNPLFVEQMAAMMTEREADLAFAIPPTIHAVLGERLERLSTEERSVIERSSVIGRDFALTAVASLSPEDQRAALGQHLLSLVRKGFVRPDPHSNGEDRFSFDHVLIRDAAYAAMPKELRAVLHEQVAGWAEISGTDELIGYHLEQAYLFRAELGIGDTSIAERAAIRLGAAGRRAMTRGDAPAAAALLRRSANLSESVPVRRRALLSDLGAALRDAGDLGASDEVLSEAIRLAQEAGDRRAEARAVVERAFTRRHHHAGLEEARSVVEQTTPVLMELGDDAGIAKALTLSGQSEYVRCRVSAGESLLERALEHAERAGDAQQARLVLMYLARTCLEGPLPAEEGIARLSELSTRLPDDRTLAAFTATVRAPLEAMLGRFEAARELYSNAQETLEELGRSLTLANLRLDSGLVELLAGDAEAAERELRAGLETLEAIGEANLLPSMAALTGQALLAQGRLDEAGAQAARSEELSSPEDVFSQVEWRTLRASIYARTGRPADAVALATEAVALMEDADALLVKAGAFAALGEALAASGQAAEASASFLQAAALHERKGSTVLSAAAREAAQLGAGGLSRSTASGSARGDLAGGT